MTLLWHGGTSPKYEPWLNQNPLICRRLYLIILIYMTMTDIYDHFSSVTLILEK